MGEITIDGVVGREIILGGEEAWPYDGTLSFNGNSDGCIILGDHGRDHGEIVIDTEVEGVRYADGEVSNRAEGELTINGKIDRCVVITGHGLTEGENA
ncbi:hypothetical protein CMI45_02310 [Candidatus Pacearchaeota archaeon]|nr:hypothetical protein [Candidatus Pacearchaeota archaeon]